jgi:hypothetical protein
MQQFNKRIVMSVMALSLVCGISLSSSALAHEADDSSTTSNSGSSSSETETHNSTSTIKSHVETGNETENHAHDLMEQFRQQGQAKVQAEAKDRIKTHTQAQRQQSCSARKASLTKRMNNSVAAAQRHKTVFDNIYTKVKTFKDSKNLTVANYDSLVATVDSAQADSAAKISALQSLDVTIDCTQIDSVTTNVSSFREAVGATRDSLKNYRKALVSLIKAVHGSAKSTDTNDSSTNDTTTQ